MIKMHHSPTLFNSDYNGNIEFITVLNIQQKDCASYFLF